MMQYSALVPVKQLTLVKSRLADYLSRAQREALVLDMLRHVVSTLCDSEFFEQVYVVSADLRVLELAQQWGAEALREEQPGHNPALHAAALTILQRAAWRHGVYSWTSAGAQEMLARGRQERRTARMLESMGLLTISADLPLLAQADLRALLAQAQHASVVLAPSSEGSGTNAILMRPPLVLPYLFGPDSLAAYIQAARRRRVSYTLLHTANLGLDIDTPDDLHELEQQNYAWAALAGCAR